MLLLSHAARNRFGNALFAALWLIGAAGRTDAQTLVATVTYPASGTVNADMSQAIQWTTIANAQAYYLYIGTTLGAKDLVNTGEIHQTSYAAANLPAGPTLYVRLHTKVANAWRFSDSTFTAAAAAVVLAATITYPANAAVHADLSHPVQWTSIAGAQAYYLYVGTSRGGTDLVNSGETQQTSYVLKTFPANQTLYARIHTKQGGVWRYTESTFSGDVLTPQLTSPVNGTATADWMQPIQWTTVPNADGYYLYVGRTPGAHDLIDTGEIHQTSYSAAGLPANQVLYARIFALVGGVWRYTDSSFSGDILTTRITSPVNGATAADFSQPIQWTTVPHAQAYYLYVGTSVGAKNVIDTGEIHQTLYSAATLPPNQLLYARMYAEVGGVWRYTDSTFTGDILTARLTTPVNGTTTADFAQPIQWTTVPSAQAYYLYVGTSVGTNNLINTGEIHQTSYPAGSLPSGQTVFARIYAKVGGVWRGTDSSFSGTTITSTITYPANGAVNADLSQPIQWTPVPNADAYYLYVGTTLGGKDVVNTGEIHTLSYIPGNIPAGQTLYARIYTKLGGAWRFSDSTFSAATLTSTLIYPANGATNADMSQPFQWTATAGAQAYYLYVGTTPGAGNIINSGERQGLSFDAPLLPVGPALYVRLYTKMSGQWRYVDSTFTAAPLVATLTAPVPSQTGVTARSLFTWNGIPNAEAYFLDVGTAPGDDDVINSGETVLTSFAAAHLPHNVTLFARLYTRYHGVWRPAPDVMFTSGSLASAFVYPVRGSVGVQVAQPFEWTPVSGADSYRLIVSTTPGGADLLDTGPIHDTTHLVTSLPSTGTLYARVYTTVGGAQTFADTVFTLLPSAGPADLVYPVDGANAADTGQPFEWSPAGLADAYRLELGTSPGANDLHDSGPIRMTKRLVPDLPLGATIYGRLSTAIGGQWYTRDFTFSSVSTSVTTTMRIKTALWATDFVRSMAGTSNLPSIVTPLADTLSALDLPFATCVDFSKTLLAALADVNIGASVRLLDVAFNPNGFDGHTLVEMLNDDSHEWLLLDPTFDLTVMRADDGSWATAEDVSVATAAERWDDVSYLFLGDAGDTYARGYYLDYPLLFLDVYHENQSPVSSSIGGSVLPYLQAVPLPSGLMASYAARCGGATTAELTLDGNTVTIGCNGVDGLAPVFTAGTIGTTPQTPSSLTIYRPRRYKF